MQGLENVMAGTGGDPSSAVVGIGPRANYFFKLQIVEDRLPLPQPSKSCKSAWPQALARLVSTSSHAYFAIEEDAFALQLATRLSTRSTTSRKIPFAHRARRARRRKKKRGGGAAGC